MKLRILISFLLIVISACSTVKEDVENIIIEPKIDLIKDSDLFLLNFTFVVPSDDPAQFKALREIRKIKVEVMDNRGTTYNKYTKETSSFEKAGIYCPNADACAVKFSKLILDAPDKEINDLNYRFTVYYSRYKDTKSKSFGEILYDNKKPIDHYPVILKYEDNLVNTGVFTIRKKVVEEYIPNSELLRVEVTNSKGKTVFNSEEGGNFMQVIYPVYPEDVSNVYTYDYPWLLQNNNGERVSPGKYGIKLIIPAFPNPYVNEIYYEWKEK